MRPLAPRAALACELATKERCDCRCRGALHGAGRVSDLAALPTLPEDDPHYVPAGRLPGGRELVGVQTTVDPAMIPERPIYRMRRQ